MFAILLAGALSVTAPVDVHVEIMIAPEQLRRGLQGHRPLDANEGMLFVLPAPEVARFWMRDMSFAIDILFLNADGRVDSLAASAPPCSGEPCATYQSQAEVTHVLEVPAGFAKRHGVAPGARLQIDAPRHLVRVP